jgi:hypothetical protein
MTYTVPASLNVNRLGTTFRWLRNAGVSSSRIGSLLRLSPVHVRVIASRGHGEMGLKIAEIGIKPVLQVPDSDEYQELGIREPAPEDIDGDRALVDRAEIESELQSILVEYGKGHQYGGGIKRLLQSLKGIGYPSDAGLLTLSATIHRHLGWFHANSGHSRSSLYHAEKSMALCRAAYSISDQDEDVEGYIEAALVGANACLLHRQPEAALKLLNRAEEAAEYIERPLGSQHNRLAGVAYFQQGEDGIAKTKFQNAMHLDERIDNVESASTIWMNGHRHLPLLSKIPNLDIAMETRQRVREWFGDEGLEFSMSANWAAACGLATGSPEAIIEAREILHENSARSAQYGHQATVTLLLSILPELGLQPNVVKNFVRVALYENAARSL